MRTGEWIMLLGLRLRRLAVPRRLNAALAPGLGTAASRMAFSIRRFHLATAAALFVGSLITIIFLRQLQNQADAASGSAAIGARQPALALLLAELQVERSDSGDNAAFDAALAQLRVEQATLIAVIHDPIASSGVAMAELDTLYFGPGYGLKARLDDLFALAMRLRATQDDPEQAGLVMSMRREIVEQVANRLSSAAELLRRAAQERIATVAWVFRLAAFVAIGLVVVWLLASLSLERRLERTLGLLEWLAARDGLTGALTHSAFAARLRQMLLRAKPESGVGVVMFDLDNFHALNATSGDAAGDAALSAVARRLRHAAGPNALVARLGSDSFGVAIQGISGGHDRLSGMAAAMAASLRAPVPFEGQLLHVSASGGTALAPQDSVERTELLRMAGIAVREAKRTDKGSVRGFHAVDPAAQARREAVLRALASGEMMGVEPWLQPIVRCDSGRVMRFEVLARWTHPELGRVPPAEFLPIAEAIGRLPMLSAKVRNLAMLRLAELHRALRAEPGLADPDAPLPGIAVNLAPSELAMPGMLGALEAALAAAELGLDMLTIEVTEDMLIEGVDAGAADALQALRARGMRLNLDNFGTGFANLSHLQRFEMDGLKIARPFIAAIGEDQRAETIIRGVLGLGQGLGIETVAEGVETAVQMDFMREAGCDVAQGYLIAPPMPAGEIPFWMRARRPPVSSPD